MRRASSILLLAFFVAGLAASSASAGSSIKSDEEVVFFTTSAHREGDHWVVPIHGWIFEPEEDSLWRAGLLGSLEAELSLEGDSARAARFRRIARWFLVDNERGKKITVEVAGVRQRLSRSGKDGHFRGTLEVPAGRTTPASWRVRAETRKGDHRVFEGRVLAVPEEGLSVVSDFDDTIKITGSKDRRVALERTFLDSFRAVPGMVAVYRHLQKQGAVFHYVSAGPWHLYVPIRDFLERSAFPEGSIDLQAFRVKDDTRWNLLHSPRQFKLDTIEALLASYPRRHFLLIGDSSQVDPEVYGELARRHPTQIDAIYIREVEVGEMGAHRVKRAFEGVKARTQVFRDPSELTL